MWLLNAEMSRILEQAQRNGVLPNAEHQREFVARYNEETNEQQPRALTVAGTTAEIRVEGILTERPSYMAFLYGGGNLTYNDIMTAISAAEQNPQVQEIVFRFNSPGGQVSGLFDAIAAMQSIKKPKKGIVSLAASAAYALASQAGSLQAVNKASLVGSIGIRADYTIWPEDVTITSTAAPNKAPDLSTEEGKAIIRAELDAVHQLFAEAIAEGRATTVANVNENFGKGGVFLAEEALSRGMLDSVAATGLKLVTTASSIGATATKLTPETGMDLNTIKAQHPELFAQIVQIGAKAERDRVCAHLTMGEASGDTATAFKAIKDGDEMTATHTATYMAAGMNKRDVSNHTADTTEAQSAAAKAKAAADTTQTTTEEEVVKLVASRHGIEVK